MANVHHASSAQIQAPKHVAAVLYPGFQLLDLAGPLDVLNLLSHTNSLQLSLLGPTLAPVSTSIPLQSEHSPSFSQSIVPTHTYATAPDDIEVLIIPGGYGTRDEANIAEAVEFVRNRYEGLRWCLTVCTGSMILAKAGCLERKRATTNKRVFDMVKSQFTGVNWVAKARWVVAENTWTSSGISAGIDLIYAWIAHVWGEETAQLLADASEYVRNTDPDNDPFAERWGATQSP